MHTNFTKSKAIKYLNYDISGVLASADIIHDNGFFVGNHCKDNSENIEALVNILEEFAKENKAI